MDRNSQNRGFGEKILEVFEVGNNMRLGGSQIAGS